VCRGVGAALLLLLSFHPGAVQGEEAPAAPAPDTIRVPASPLEAASLEFAVALADPSGDALAAILAPTGIRLHLGSTGHTGLSARQAAASIRDFLRGFEGGSAIVSRAAPVAGSQVGGYAEVLWTGRIAGTSQDIQRTLFVGFLRDAGAWRVDEVRLIR
jgi:hypothetical protein